MYDEGSTCFVRTWVKWRFYSMLLDLHLEATEPKGHVIVARRWMRPNKIYELAGFCPPDDSYIWISNFRL